MRVLVTGADGFVGRHTVRDFRDRGHKVYGIDKKSGDDLSYIEIARHAVDYFEPDVIIHHASSCSTPGSVTSPYKTYRDTVMSAAHILEAARPKAVPTIITSSVKARDGMTPYGAAKQMVEIWAREYRTAYKMPVVINRPGTIYGPGQEGSPESGWVAWFLEAKRTDQPVTVNGDGFQVRDLLYVTDYVDLLALQAGNMTFYDGLDRIFDIGGGSANAVTVIDMVRFLDLGYVYGPDRSGDARNYVGYNDVPGWEPKIFWKESGIFQ
jgi:nucleoside-diphosphate-sugar epimerase